MVGIPKIIHMIWIGPFQMPWHWMKTWPEKHPDWEFVLWDNQRMAASNFYNQHLIDEYMRRKAYAGVADLMRYEILYRFGGIMPGSDSVCLMPIDELFPDPKAYGVIENEQVGEGRIAPLYACQPNNKFAYQLIHHLHALKPKALDVPWKSVGNNLMRDLVAEIKPDITLFPSHYFIPHHFLGVHYKGDGPIYAEQMWGSTRKIYDKPHLSKEEIEKITYRVFTIPEDSKVQKNGKA
ncbi:MAG: glycosyltransferase family 32 protein [Alphaproteobacteria bacterium]